MNVEQWMRHEGGVVRVAHARDAGFSVRTLSRLVADGVALRPRGGWLALRGADPLLISAARAGVVLTCMTQAARLGLWTSSDDPRDHVGAAPHATAVAIDRSRAIVHWNVPWIARAPARLVDPVENVLQLVAFCQPFEAAFAVWESALRKGLVTREALLRYPLSGQAVRLVAEVTPFSDSGLESFVLVRLRWLPVPVVPQVVIAGRPVDFLIGDRLVLQIDGGHHVGVQRDADIAHDAYLLSLGYHVIRVSYVQVTQRWSTVHELILRAIAQGLHEAA
jgi:very-short-patch-repair endonuclease